MFLIYCLTDHLLKVLDEILLAFAGDFGCAGEAHAPRADGGVLADFKEFQVHAVLGGHIAPPAATDEIAVAPQILKQPVLPDVYAVLLQYFGQVSH